jgi:hypothetical protein
MVTSIPNQPRRHWLQDKHTESMPYIVHRCRAICSNSPVSNQERAEKRLRTTNDKLHVAYKAVNDLKRLGCRHASLFVGEAVQPMKHILDLTLPK